MMKMLVKLDIEKIVKEGKYDVNKINAYLIDAFAKKGMKKDSDNWFINGNFTTCGSLIIKLSKAEWLKNNVVEWLWYDTDDSSVEDLRAHYCKESMSA